jgi:lysozyme
MKTSPKGIRLITEFEGFRANAYLDPIGIPTIGYGFIEGVSLGDTMTQYEAQQRMGRELQKYERGVMQACRVQVNQNQFDALVCFAFNVGVVGMTGSSVIKALNRGDTQAAARAFGLWNKAGGKVWPGLTRRRAAEAALFLEPVADDMSDPVEGPVLAMPQSVDPETPMTSSTINRAGLVAGGTATVATVSEVVNSVGYIKRGVVDLETWAVPILLIVTLAAVGYIVWERYSQRKGGYK